METAFVVLDTNTFLHYVSLEQVGWGDAFPNQNVVLFICPPTIRELNKHKDTPRTSKIRDRATTALRKIDAWADTNPPVKLRDTVEVRFIVHDSAVDFAAHNLIRDIADDHFIAAMIDLRAEASPTPVWLLTRDTGLKLKARAHGFSAISLPDSELLPDEVLPDEKKIADLQAQVRELQDARPKLSLSFTGRSSNLNLTFQRSDELSAVDISNRMEDLRRKYPKMAERANASDSGAPPAQTLLGAALGFSVVDQESIRKYNGSLDGFFREYEEYLENLAVFYVWESRTAAINISLINAGSCPAEDVDIFMHFPDGFELFREEDYEAEPKAPKAPAKPASVWDGISTGFSIPDLYPLYRHDLSHLRPPSGPSNVGGPRIKRTNSYDVKVNVRKSKHGIQEPLDVMYLTFEPSAIPRGFSIDYEIHASNLPKRVTGKLNVII